jgi:hypothetical protein
MKKWLLAAKKVEEEKTEKKISFLFFSLFSPCLCYGPFCCMAIGRSLWRKNKDEDVFKQSAKDIALT